MKTDELSNEEAAVLRHLLSIDFRGRDQLLEQARFAKVLARPIPHDPTVTLYVDPDRAEPADSRLNRVPVQLETTDQSGAHVVVLLHVIDGYLSEIEFVRDDGDPMIGFPNIAGAEISLNQHE